MADSLALYKKKRNFALTNEPAGGGTPNAPAPVFVIQKHWASRLHYDLRLELDGVMKSWAVPKGPSYDPKDKRMAVPVEDHPIAYNQFEGDIPAGHYGAGKVIIWDEGHWAPTQNARKGYRDGVLKFELNGVKLKGKWALIRMRGRGEKQPPWLLVKEKDEFARSAAEFNVVDEAPDSVVPLRNAVKGVRKATKATKASKATKATKATGAGPADATLLGKDAELPTTLAPQLATLVDGVPSDPADWLFEIKFDGYRVLARVDASSVKLFTRNGHDWTHKLEKLAMAIRKLKLSSGWLDGEIVVLSDAGVPSFQALQNAFDASRTADIVYYLFDAPYLGGRDLRREPLEVRRECLRQLLGDHPPSGLRFSEVFDAAPRNLITSACQMGLEGVIGKRRGSPYVTRRTGTWIKLKCAKRQEFIIAGYTDPKGSRHGFGSLLLAVNDDQGTLRYAGNVGTGFDKKTLVDLKDKLDAHATSKRPFAASTGMDRVAHWVQPRLVAEVSFANWTSTGRVRNAVFRGLRRDKAPKTITRDKPTSVKTIASDAPARIRANPSTRAKVTPSLRVTHPERIIDSSTGLTKLDMVRYYDLVAPLLVEHLKARPVSLVRAPAGIDGELFFQKHLEGKIPGVNTLDRKLDPNHPPLIEVPTPDAVTSAAQMNVIEFHTWNAVKTAIDKPDRMTFDLDPGEGTPWKSMQKAAELVRVFLSELGLASFAKTSGGKGLHIVVPLRKHYGWEAIRRFSQAIVQHLARTLPQLFVSKSGPRNRVGKIFVDYLRNGFGATTVSAWSARARPGLGVSVPLHWDEINSIKSGAHWQVTNIHTRLDQGNKPWDAYAPQAAGKAMKQLGFDPQAD